jgi:hypothetical protein
MIQPATPAQPEPEPQTTATGGAQSTLAALPKPATAVDAELSTRSLLLGGRRRAALQQVPCPQCNEVGNFPAPLALHAVRNGLSCASCTTRLALGHCPACQAVTAWKDDPEPPSAAAAAAEDAATALLATAPTICRCHACSASFSWAACPGCSKASPYAMPPPTAEAAVATQSKEAKRAPERRRSRGESALGADAIPSQKRVSQAPQTTCPHCSLGYFVATCPKCCAPSSHPLRALLARPTGSTISMECGVCCHRFPAHVVGAGAADNSDDDDDERPTRTTAIERRHGRGAVASDDSAGGSDGDDSDGVDWVSARDWPARAAAARARVFATVNGISKGSRAGLHAYSY